MSNSERLGADTIARKDLLQDPMFVRSVYCSLPEEIRNALHAIVEADGFRSITDSKTAFLAGVIALASMQNAAKLIEDIDAGQPFDSTYSTLPT